MTRAEILDLLDEIDDVRDSDPRVFPRRHLAALLERAGFVIRWLMPNAYGPLGPRPPR